MPEELALREMLRDVERNIIGDREICEGAIDILKVITFNLICQSIKFSSF